MIYQKIIQINIEINFTAVSYVNLYSKFKMNPAFENIFFLTRELLDVLQGNR